MNEQSESMKLRRTQQAREVARILAPFKANFRVGEDLLFYLDKPFCDQVILFLKEEQL